MSKKIKQLDESPADYESTPVKPILSLGDLPSGWSVSTVRQIAQIIRGVSYSKSDVKDTNNDGYIPILRATNIQDNGLVLDRDLVYVPKKYISEEQKLKIGDIVIATSSGSKHLVGKTAQVEADWSGSFGAFCAVLRPSENVESRYLGYFFNSPIYKSYISAKAMGVNINNLRRGDIEELHVPLASIHEQKRIVAEIEKQFSRLDEAVANLKRVKANLKRYKDAVLKAAIEGKLTEEWRKAHPDAEPASELLKCILVERRKKWEDAELMKMKAKGKKPKDDKWKAKYVEAQTPKPEDTFEIPNAWAWTNLGQLSWSVKDGPHFSPKYSESGIPFISGGNIRPDGVDFSTAKYISPELHAEFTERCKPELGDLLYTKGGTTGIARINTEKREFSVWVHVAVLKLVDSIERFYLQYALNSLHCYRQSQRYTHGVGNQDLGLTRMIWITVPLPPFVEQKEIVKIIDQRMSIISDVENEVDINMQRAERMKQSILSKAFSGSLVQVA